MANGFNAANVKPGQWLDWLMKGLLGITTALVVSIWSTVGSLDNRVTAIEASRFTTADGLLIWREVDSKVSRDELISRLDHLGVMIQSIQQQLADHALVD